SWRKRKRTRLELFVERPIHKEQALSCHCLLLPAGGECRRQGSILRGVAVNQPGSPPRQRQRHFIRGRIESAAFCLQNRSGRIVAPQQCNLSRTHRRLPALWSGHQGYNTQRAGSPLNSRGQRCTSAASESESSASAVVLALCHGRDRSPRLRCVQSMSRNAGAAPRTQSLNSYVRQGGGRTAVDS